jgi:hypothetical protein
VLPGTKPAAATAPENVCVEALLAVGVTLSLPPQAASTQAAAIEVRRRLVRLVELTDIVGGPCWLYCYFLAPLQNKFRLAVQRFQFQLRAERAWDVVRSAAATTTFKAGRIETPLSETLTAET